MLKKVREMRQRKATYELGIRRLEMEERLNQKQDGTDEYIDQEDDMAVYEQLEAQRDIL